MDENVKLFRIEFEGQEEILAQMARIRKASEDLKEGNKELAKEAKAGNLEAGKAFEENRVQIAKNNKEISNLTKQYEANSRVQKDTTGSLNNMRDQLRMMVKEYDGLSKEQRENADIGGVMQKQIKGLTSELKILESETGRNQRNVGNYAEAIDTANMSITEMTKALGELKKMPLTNLSPEEVKKAEQAMGQLTDSIGKANARIKVQAMDDIPALVASLQGVVAASQLVVGSMALFGVEDERVKKLTQTMVQLVGVSQSLATINQLIASGEAAALAVKVKTIAANVTQAVSTKAVAAAQWLYNTALIGTKRALDALGIGLLLTLLAALVGAVTLLWKNWDKVTGSLRNVAQWLGFSKKATEDLTESTDKLVASNEEFLKQAERKAKLLDFEIKFMKALGVSQDDIIEKQRQLLELRLQEGRVAVQNAEIQAKAGLITVQQLQETIATYQQAQQELLIFEAEQIRAGRERSDLAEKEKNEEIRRINELAAKRVEEEERQALALIERQKRDEKARLELNILEARSEEERINARIALLKWETEQLLENDQLTQNERLLIEAESIEKQLDLENTLLERKLAQQKEYDDLEKQRQLDLEQFEVELLQRKKEREEEQLRFEQSITDARIDSAMALTEVLKATSNEQSILFRAAKAIQKAVALSEIGINLQRELQAINVAAAVQDAALPGSGRVFALTQRIRAVSQSLAAAAQVAALNSGGVVSGYGNRDTVPAMMTPGEGVLVKPAMESGQVFTLSGTPKQIASYLNQSYGGVEFRNRGGMIGSTASTSTRNASAELSQEQLAQAFSNIKIVTTVEDINAGVGSEAIRNEIANYS